MIAVVLTVAALFFVAVVLGGYAAYRVWTSRSGPSTAETVWSDPVPASVPAMATDSAPSSPPPAPPPGTDGEAAEGGAASPFRRAPVEKSAVSGATAAAGGSAARETYGRSAPAPGAPARLADEPASQGGERGTFVGGTPAAGPSSSPSLPTHPPIYFECTGTSDVCGAVTAAFEQGLEREGLPRAARPDDAEILVNATATLVDTHQDQQYGTNFVVQTFSLELRAEGTRDGAAVSMPAAKTFSFDRRFGGERAAEQARLMAAAAIERIQKFWTKRVGG